MKRLELDLVMTAQRSGALHWLSMDRRVTADECQLAGSYQGQQRKTQPSQRIDEGKLVWHRNSCTTLAVKSCQLNRSTQHMR